MSLAPSKSLDNIIKPVGLIQSDFASRYDGQGLDRMLIITLEWFDAGT